MRETLSGNLTTSWETAGISEANDGTIVRYGESGFSPGIAWMVHCDTETC